MDNLLANKLDLSEIFWGVDLAFPTTWQNSSVPEHRTSFHSALNHTIVVLSPVPALTGRVSEWISG